MVYKYFDKKSSATSASKFAGRGIKSMPNQLQLADERHNWIIGTFIKI